MISKTNAVLAVILSALITANFYLMIFVYIPMPIEEYHFLVWAGAVFSLTALVSCSICLSCCLSTKDGNCNKIESSDERILNKESE
jgi:hypothetical protein